MTQLLNILKALERLTLALNDMQSALSGTQSAIASLQAADARRNAIHGLTAAKALTDLQDRELVYLSYLNTSGDGMGGFFEFVSASAVTADDVDVIQPTYVSGNGRLIRRL